MVCRVKPRSSIAKKLLQRSPAKTLKARVKKYLEKDFSNDVIELAQSCGWKVAHFPPIRTASGHWLTVVKADGKGWPDLFLVRNAHAIVVELKTESQLSDDQIAWLSAFLGTPVRAFVWTPSDWDTIKDVLLRGV
jgi:hypothetical protein